MNNNIETIERAAANLADPNICKTDNWIAGAKWQKEQDEAKYKALLDSLIELLNYIKSDSVYNLLRRGVKSPSSTGMDDCNDSNYFDLYTISTNLRNKQS